MQPSSEKLPKRVFFGTLRRSEVTSQDSELVVSLLEENISALCDSNTFIFNKVRTRIDMYDENKGDRAKLSMVRCTSKRTEAVINNGWGGAILG